MDSITKYYQDYHTLPDRLQYKLANSVLTSRVQFICQFIQKYVPTGGKILDIGCGDMSFARLLPDYVWTGIDINTDMSDHKAIKQDLMQVPYPFEDSSFHAAVCSEVLEHVWDLEVVHREAKRILTPQGTYIISTPNFDNIDHLFSRFRQVMYDSQFLHLKEHIRFYNTDTHTKFLEANGFDVVEETGADSQYVQAFLHPRQVLAQWLADNAPDAKIEPVHVDMLIGQMFPRLDHTCILVAKPK